MPAVRRPTLCTAGVARRGRRPQAKLSEQQVRRIWRGVGEGEARRRARPGLQGAEEGDQSNQERCAMGLLWARVIRLREGFPPFVRYGRGASVMAPIRGRLDPRRGPLCVSRVPSDAGCPRHQREPSRPGLPHGEASRPAIRPIPGTGRIGKGGTWTYAREGTRLGPRRDRSSDPRSPSDARHPDRPESEHPRWTTTPGRRAAQVPSQTRTVQPTCVRMRHGATGGRRSGPYRGRPPERRKPRRSRGFRRTRPGFRRFAAEEVGFEPTVP